MYIYIYNCYVVIYYINYIYIVVNSLHNPHFICKFLKFCNNYSYPGFLYIGFEYAQRF